MHIRDEADSSISGKVRSSARARKASSSSRSRNHYPRKDNESQMKNLKLSGHIREWDCHWRSRLKILELPEERLLIQANSTTSIRFAVISL
ncbi:hypothetical protein Tco_0364780 [Tanacetum coccineum]